jgi:hypothetical protein
VDQQQDQLEVKTSVGSVKATGNLVVILVALVGCSLVLGYMLRDHDLRQTETTASARAERMEQFRDMERNQLSLKDSMDENTYVQTLTAEEKKALRMDMPESLRQKVHR